MKRVFAAILVLVMVLGLCACGNKYAKYDSINQKLDAGDYEGAILEIMAMYEAQQGGSNDDGSKPTEPAKPTDEEWDVIWRYESIVRSLNNYAKGNSINYYDEENQVHLDGSAALAKYYAELVAMDSVDVWLESEYVQGRLNEDTNTDRQAVLAGFSKLENVLLHYSVAKTDNMGNVSVRKEGVWTYDQQGRPIRITDFNETVLLPKDRWNWGTPLTIVYGEDGRISQLKAGYDDTVNALGVPVYDDAGNIIAVNMKNNNGEWQDTYTYDDQGRVIEYSRPYYNHMLDAERFRTYTYTYDEDGKLLQQVETYYSGWDYTIISTYLYDETGKLTGIAWSQNRKDNWSNNTSTQEIRLECVYDDQGRLIQYAYYPGDVIEEDGETASPDFASEVVDIVYGDYYFYNP